ncbi:MAG: glucose-6-phosphate isomerase [Solirubrobacteraceae bacterium]
MTRATLTTAVPDPGALDSLVARATEARVPERLLERDATLWGPPGTPEIADRLGWLDAPESAAEAADDLLELASRAREDGFTDLLLLGMGGSSLAPLVLWRWRTADPERATGGLRLRLLDSTDPDAVASVDAAVDPDRTLVVVATKSGGTVETLSLLAHFRDARPEGRRYVAITDPGSGLEQLATDAGFRQIIHGDPTIGGRYSALSPFGTVPAALLGLDVAAMAAGGRDALASLRETGIDDAGVRLGLALAALARGGRDKILVECPDPRLSWFGLWFEQLVAESTGKGGVGLLPIISPTLRPDREADDRLRLRIVCGPGDAPDDDVPTLTLDLSAADGDAMLGSAFVTCEVATAVAGWALELNPFNQPDVQAAKDAARTALDGNGRHDRRRPPALPPVDRDSILATVDGLAAPDYLAILAYLPSSNTAIALLERLREALARHTDAAITTGFGPRYLHSTGQLHKGGPARGRFLFLRHDPRAHRPIPGSPFGFGELLAAQADGDVRALTERGRATTTLTLGTDWVDGLERIIEALREDVA